jgi:hypothetical protein
VDLLAHLESLECASHDASASGNLEARLELMAQGKGGAVNQRSRHWDIKQIRDDLIDLVEIEDQGQRATSQTAGEGEGGFEKPRLPFTWMT